MSEKQIDSQILSRFYRDEARGYLSKILLAGFFMVIAAAATTLSAWIIQYVIDDIFIDKNAALVLPVALGIAAIYMVKGGATYFSSAILAGVSASVSAHMRVKMMKSILAREVRFFDTHETADLINRISNVTRSAGELVRTVANAAMKDGLTVLFLVGYMFSIDWVLSLVTFVIAPIGIWGVQLISRRIRGAVSSEFQQNSTFMQLLYERLAGIRLVKAFQIEDETKEVLDETVENLRERAVRIARVSALSSPLMETLGGIVVALMIVYAGWSVISQGNSPGEVFSFIIAFLSAYEPIKRLASLRVNLVKYSIPLGFYYEILDEEPRQRDGDLDLQVSAGEIEFRDLQFTYEDGVSALNGVSFTAPAGKVTALVGRSGSGKSTLFSLLQRFYDPQSGDIRIDGQVIQDGKIKDLREALALIPQDTVVFTGTIAENIAIGDLNASREAIEAAGRAAHMDEFVSQMADGYDTRLGDGEASLSGGQKQRLSIARAILRDAPILMLDEATSALDSNSEAIVQQAIAEASEGKTTLVIAHRLSTIRDADQIVVMDQGRVIETGSHAELVKLGGVYKELHDLQFSRAEG